MPELSLPYMGRILLKGLEKHNFLVFLVFLEATCAAVHLYVCFSRFSLVKQDSCCPNAFNESWELPADMSAAAYKEMEDVIGS